MLDLKFRKRKIQSGPLAERPMLSIETSQSRAPVRYVSKLPIVIASALALILVATGISRIGGSSEKGTEVANAYVASVLSAIETQAKHDAQIDMSAFDSVNITAKSAYIWDIANKKALYEKKAYDQLPLASVSKVMTALISKRLLGDDTVVTIEESDLAIEGDSGLVLGERWKSGELRDFMLLVSSNDAAHALARASETAFHETSGNANKSFIDYMNDEAYKLGLRQTRYRNPTGLDIGLTSGANGSARDMAILFEYVYKTDPDLLEVTHSYRDTFTSLDGRVHHATGTDVLANTIPQLISGKTGYTDLAGGNLVVLFDNGLGRPIVIAVLGSTYEGRFDDVQALYSAVKKAITGV